VNLNPIQRFVADTYENGEFSHIQTVEEAAHVGDTLFTFLVYEAGDAEDFEDFAGMVDRARDQVATVYNALLDREMEMPQ
jgi:hypothetical protein